MSSLLRVIRGAIHFCSSLAESQRMSVGNPDSSVQACSTWARANVFSSLLPWISFGLEASLGVRSPQGGAHWMQVGHSTTPKPCVGQGAAWMLIGRLQHCQGPPIIRWGPIVNFPLGFNSFHHWQWLIFSISAWIHLWGWLMRSGPSSFDWGWDWDWSAEGQARVLGLAPPVWVGQHWGLLEGGGSGGSSCMGITVPGVLSCSLLEPSTRKRVRPGGNVGSLPRSPSSSNLTCFFSFTAGVGVSSHCTLLLDLQGLVYKLRFFIEWLSCSVTGQDHGGLGEGDWCLLGHWGMGLSCHLDLSLPLEQECLLTSDFPVGVSSFSHLATSVPYVRWEGTGSWGGMIVQTSFASQRGLDHSNFTLQASPGHVPVEFPVQLPHAPVLSLVGEYTWCNSKFSSVNLFCHPQDFFIRGS